MLMENRNSELEVQDDNVWSLLEVLPWKFARRGRKRDDIKSASFMLGAISWLLQALAAHSGAEMGGLIQELRQKADLLSS